MAKEEKEEVKKVLQSTDGVGEAADQVAKVEEVAKDSLKAAGQDTKEDTKNNAGTNAGENTNRDTSAGVGGNRGFASGRGADRFLKNEAISNLTVEMIDYKNYGLLSRFISGYGKIMPSRITGLSYRMQRKISREIKRARQMALISYLGR